MSIFAVQKKSIDTMQHTFDDKTMSELLGLILLGNGTSDEVMWYVLHERADKQLRLKYKDYEEGIWDAYEDLRDDFFLYLREGVDSKNRVPYSTLSSIKSKNAFEKWLLSTWRNFLNNRVEKEKALNLCAHVPDIADKEWASTQESNKGASVLLTDDQKIEIVSQLIAYCDQVFLPRGRFVFLRTLLTLLNKKQALPEKEMAEALGMTDINYRVTNHRLKANMRNFMDRLIRGERLRLDDKHSVLAEHITTGYDKLYETLMITYDDVLHALKQRDAVMALRLTNIQPDGTLLHEDEWKEYQMDIRSFWNRLKRELNR